MATIHIITVGKIKDSHIQALEQDYLKRLTSLKIQLHELKAHREDREKEGKEVLKKLDELSPCFPITLEEKGQQMASPELSEWLMGKVSQGEKPVLILGGASGHGEEVLKRSKFSLSLGKLTYPHQLARLILVEQIYRTHCIHQGHPYHK